MHVHAATREEKNCYSVRNVDMFYIVTENANAWIGNDTKGTAEGALIQEILRKILCCLQL